MDASRTHCTLDHRVFTLFGDVVFRAAASDATPVMAMRLGDQEVTMPLRSLQREFGIDDESEDGRMLGLIAEALQFVTALTPGQELPTEVRTGAASWQPDALHAQIAGAKLQMQLIGWLGGVRNAGAGATADRTVAETDATTLISALDDPAIRPRLQRALGDAASELGVAGKDDVLGMIEALAADLAFVEALRDRLLRRVESMVRKVDGLGKGSRADATHVEILSQVRRLSHIAARQIQARFDDLDAQTGETMAALRHADSQRAFIRSNRDWLYRSQLAWEATLAAWDAASPIAGDTTSALLAITYRFLAPRYMPVTEWLRGVKRAGRQKELGGPSMVW